MITIRDLLNKIKWNNNLDERNYSVYYFDRILNKLLLLPFEKIEVKDSFIISDNKTIPMHRIREVRMNDKLIWKRKILRQPSL